MHLTIIAKAPEPGRVKTRLCPPCSPADAAEVAAAALADTVAAVDATCGAADGPPLRRVMLLEGRRGESIPPDYDVVAQRGEGLAARLANGFTDLGPGVIVSMDSPAAGCWLGDAVAAVSAGYDVLGLATDGGYWVIGLARVDPAVFDGVPMSASHTGMCQLRRLHHLGRPVRLLPVARDLDTIADLRAVANTAGTGRLPAVARSVLDRIG